jgi:hypothetical protein
VRSIHRVKSLGPKKQQTQQVEDSRADVPEGADIEPAEVMMVETTWMQPYLSYMLHKKLPEDVVKAQRIVRRSKAFVIVKGELYKKCISGSCKHVSPHRRDMLYCMTSMEASAVTMPAAE